jgi:protein SCO1/2
MSNVFPTWTNIAVALLSSAIVLPVVAGPTFADEKIEELEGVGITQHLDTQVPLDLIFVDEHGQEVALSEFFNNDKPIIMTLNYYKCPMLCSLTLNGLVTGMEEMEWTLGDEFEVVTLSINPDEKAPLALKNKTGYLDHYDREGAENGWHFLTGDQENITKLADALGFGYVFDEQTGEFLHTASIMFITPSGRISKYMNDVQFAAQDLRFALVEASEGKVGTLIDDFLLFNCFQYDPDRNSYSPNAWKLMRTASVLMLIMLGGGIAVLAWSTPERLQSKESTQKSDESNL